MKNTYKAGLVGLLGTVAMATAIGIANPDYSRADHQYKHQTEDEQQKLAKTNSGGFGAGTIAFYAGLGLVGLIGLRGLRVIRPTERGIIERFGKFKRVTETGLTYVIPVFDKLYRVNTTERMIDAEPQEVITKDNLNAKVDAQIYFKVQQNHESIKNSLYNVQNYELQIVQLARTTLRNIIGGLTLKEANSQRGTLNEQLGKELGIQTKDWGVAVVRAELKEIEPPKDVQTTMNQIVKAENEKIAATDFATAAETKADGEGRAAIKLAEGKKQASILEAEGLAKAVELAATAKAQAIKDVSEAAKSHFTGQAIEYEKLRVAQEVFGHGSAKYVIPHNTSLMAMLDQLSGVLPVPVEKN